MGHHCNAIQRYNSVPVVIFFGSRTYSRPAGAAKSGHAPRLSCRLRTAASTARAGHIILPLCSLSESRKSSCGAAKPLQMRSPLSAYRRVTVGGHGGLREAQMARASTV